MFKVGDAPHLNKFGLGDQGRYRTNVWDYAGVNGMKKDRMDELAMHPTVKPVALVADAILDVTKRGAFVVYAIADDGVFELCDQVCGGIRRQVHDLDELLAERPA